MTKNILGKTYALTVSENSKYVYYHNLKCATRTIIEFLSYHSKVNHSKFTWTTLPYSIKWDNYFQFSFVRNPYDRLLSCFLDKTKKAIGREYETSYYKKYKDTNFKDFVMSLSKYPWHHHDRHLALQTDLINLKTTHFVGRFENLVNDFAYVRKILDLNEGDLPRRNTTDHKHYREYYDAEMIDKVRYVYSADFERFGYEF